MQLGRSNPYVRGAKLQCGAFHHYLIRGRTAVQRRTGCFPETPLESQWANDQSGNTLCTRHESQRPALQLRCKSAGTGPRLSWRHTDTQGRQQPERRGCCSGLLRFFWESTNICGENMSGTGVGTPEFGVALSQLPGDCAPVALMAGCVMEMALELPELIPHIPSCAAPL